MSDLPPVTFVEVTEQALSLESYAKKVESDSAGAIATFSGVTRNNFKGKEVIRLEYEAYTPMAEKKLQVRRDALARQGARDTWQ